MPVHRRAAACSLLLGVLAWAGAGPAAAHSPPPAPADGAVVQAAAATFGRESPPALHVSANFVTAGYVFAGGGAVAPIVWDGAALPWRYTLDPAAVARYGEASLHAAVRQWDGIPGSRWAVAPAAGPLATSGAAADGISHVFLQRDCPAGIGGYAYRQTAGALAEDRYGQPALYLQEADVAVCAGVEPGRLAHVLAHEVGHVLGLEHLCDQGTACWQAGMGAGPHHCRLMYAGASNCAAGVTAADQNGAVHLYPTLRRLAGPGRVETAARASFAAYAPASAATVVLARADAGAHGPLAAAPLAAALGAPMLLAVPTAGACLTGVARDELLRVSTRLARVVLVGTWPDRCVTDLVGMRLLPEEVTAADDIRLGVAVADRLGTANGNGSAVFLVSQVPDAQGGLPDGIVAGAAAGVLRAPVLYSAAAQLSPPVRDWLRRRSGVRRVYVMGGGATVAPALDGQLRELGLEVVRVAGPDRVATGLALAQRAEIFGAATAVVLAAAGSWPDAVTGSAVGGRIGAPVVLTPPGGDARVLGWLAARRPVRGYLVGGRGVLPDALQQHYTRWVG